MRSTTRRLVCALASAAALLAVAAPGASAGWQIQKLDGTPYTGPMTFYADTTMKWSELGDLSHHDSCPGPQPMSAEITNAGPATPTMTIDSAYWACTLQPGSTEQVVWQGRNIPWSATIATFSGSTPKLVISNPQLRREIPGTYPPKLVNYAASDLSGTIVPSINGGPFSGGSRVTFVFAGAGWPNNAVSDSADCGFCVYPAWYPDPARLQAALNLVGIQAFNYFPLKVVQTP
jgi:hypothetical protein